MIRISETEVFGWDAAIRGMRNPMNSWDKSDTKYFDHGGVFRVPKIGSNDLKLMKSLSKAGNDHGKFLRMINVTCDITAPLYWWSEYDTYKVGTVANSCSKMHKIHAKEFTLDDFSCEHLSFTDNNGETMSWLSGLEDDIFHLNVARQLYLDTEDKHYWWCMIQRLPSSYNQKRTVQLNYQVLKTMYHARKNHKLEEWREFCKWCESLPYFREVCIEI